MEWDEDIRKLREIEKWARSAGHSPASDHMDTLLGQLEDAARSARLELEQIAATQLQGPDSWSGT